MVVTVLVAVLAVPQAAYAHAFGSIKQDNNEVTFSSDEDTEYDHLWWNHFVHFEQYDQYGARTDLTAIEQGRKAYNSSTDVIWWAANLSLKDGGLTRCVNIDWPRGRCDSFNVRFNQNYTGTPANTGWFIACHEFGHSYGFDHLTTGDFGCMYPSVDPWNPPPTGGWISQHMIDHINNQY